MLERSLELKHALMRSSNKLNKGIDKIFFRAAEMRAFFYNITNVLMSDYKISINKYFNVNTCYV